jgi:hypothetical protein
MDYVIQKNKTANKYLCFDNGYRQLPKDLNQDGGADNVIIYGNYQEAERDLWHNEIIKEVE